MASAGRRALAARPPNMVHAPQGPWSQQNTPFEMQGAAEMFEAMGKCNEQLVKAGIMLAGDGLKPSKFGKRIHFSGAKLSATPRSLGAGCV